MTYSIKACMRDYWLFLEGKRLPFIWFSLLRFISDLAPFLIAYALGSLVDFFSTYQKGDPLTEFYIYPTIIALTGAVQVWLRFYSKLKLHSIGAEIRKQVRVLAITKLMDLELTWHEKEDTGSKIQKINNGGEMIYTGIKLWSNQISFIITGIGGSLALFAFASWKYILFSLLYVGIYLVGEWYFSKKLIFWTNKLNKIKEKVSGKIHESAANILTVKSMGLHSTFEKTTFAHESKYYEIWLSTKKVGQTKSRTIKMFAAFGYGAFIFLLGWDVIDGFITVGSILVFGNYFGRLRHALEEVTNNVDEIIRIKSGVERFMMIIGKDTFEKKEKIPENWKEIIFDKVNFRYKKEAAIDSLSLKIKRNEIIGIVGASGCGKSTIVKLLLGLYKPNGGSVTIDSMDLSLVNHQSLTKNISVVLQDSEMFNASLLDNISISTTKNNKHALDKAIKIAHLQAVINKMPKGIYTMLGEKGYKVSGGERQRIGIARAVYNDTPLLILDEATSHLDSITENKIQRNIEKYLNHKTLIIVAHRISTLRNVKKIIVMDKGKIIEQGSFTELLNKKGHFFKIYSLQQKKH